MEMSPAMIHTVVDRFTALADPVRIRILLRLKEGPADVSTLVAHCSASQASISKHLSILRAAGWVESHKNGTRVICRICDPALFEICRLVCDGVLRQARTHHEQLGLHK